MTEALAADHVFLSACTQARDPGTGNLGPATMPDNGVTFTHVAATDSWTTLADGITLAFGPADHDPGAPSSAIDYAKVGASGTDRFRISGVRVAGAGLPYAALATLASRSHFPQTDYDCVIGIPTLLGDAPAGTSFAFQGALSGIGYRARSGFSGYDAVYDMKKSSVTLQVNLATGKVETAIHFIGSPIPSGTDVDFGTATGTADIDPGTGAYYGAAGAWTSPEMDPYFAQFSGRFFGPQGIEAGYAVTFLAHLPGGNDLRMSGTVFARR